MDIIEKIEDLRTKRGWSVYRLASEAGLTQSTLTNMYARGTNPSVTTIIGICDAFGITVSQFFSEDETQAILSKDETELLYAYRLLSKRNKQAVKNLIIDME